MECKECAFRETCPVGIKGTPVVSWVYLRVDLFLCRCSNHGSVWEAPFQAWSYFCAKLLRERKMITLYVQLILPLLWSVSNKLHFSWAHLDGVLSCCVPLDPVQTSDCWIITLIIIIIYVISSQYELLQMVTFSITEQSSLFVQSTCS